MGGGTDCLQHLASGNYLTVCNASETRFASPPQAKPLNADEDEENAEALAAAGPGDLSAAKIHADNKLLVLAQSAADVKGKKDEKVPVAGSKCGCF